MIADVILDDHQAVREIFAVAGNAAIEAFGERAQEFRRFGRLWEAHAAMMDEVVYPPLAEAVGRAPAALAARGRQREIAARVADLAARAEAGMEEDWDTDFEELKALFERQVDDECAVVGQIVSRLAPGTLAEMSRRGRAIRERMAA
ncbi:MAG TPA: hemerythrin domain-containing protein [Azospirillaceae bacterium]|nr:hemerythrin domain-containing protein [Azospirillaceae bacterium]